MGLLGPRSRRIAVVLGMLVLLPLFLLLKDSPTQIGKQREKGTSKNSTNTAPPTSSRAYQPQESELSVPTQISSRPLASPIINQRDWSSATVITEQFENTEPGAPHSKLRHRIVKDSGFDFPIRITDTIELDQGGAPRGFAEISAYAANQILLHSSKPLDESEVILLSDSLGWYYLEAESSPYVAVLQLEEVQIDTVEEALAAISLSDSTLTAEPNHIFYASVTANDKWFNSNSQWGLHNPTGIDIDAPEGWDIRKTAPLVKIAIVDTGVRHDHEDLKANLWKNSGEIPNNGLDDDQNGFIDDTDGYNAIEPLMPPEDDNGHGTHVAGIVGAVGNNNIGIAGVAWDTQLMAVKALNSNGKGASSTLATGIDYALQNGADILNLSWGGSAYSGVIENAIARAEANGVIVVTAAGNESSQNISYPSSSSLPNIVSVGSVNNVGELSHFSNYHPTDVDVLAPGSGILSTWSKGTDAYIRLSGTSAAAPFATGSLALFLSEYPDDNYKVQIRRLIASSEQKDGFENYCASAGIINLNSGLGMQTVTFPPQISERSAKTVKLYEGDSTQFTVSTSPDAQVTYKWFHEATLLPETTQSLDIASVTSEQRGNYTVQISDTQATTTVSFQLSVYPRMTDIENQIGNNTLVFASHEDHWTTGTEGGEQLIKNQQIPENESAFLELRAPATGMLRIAAKKALQIQLGNNALISGPNGTDAIFGPEWQTYLAIGNGPHGSTTRINYESTEKNVSLPANSLALRIPEFFEEDKYPPLFSGDFYPKTLAVGTELELTVWTTQEDLTYQWFKDDQELQGKTERILRIQSVVPADQGSYHVVATNAYGTTKSEKAIIEIDESPQAPSASVENRGLIEAEAGTSLSLSMTVTGARPISYQWKKDGYEIPGATEPVLHLDSLSMAHTGEYSLSLENAVGIASGFQPSYKLTVFEQIFPPRFNASSDDLLHYSFVEGTPLRLRIPTPAGSPLLSYSWYKDSEPIEGAQSNTYSKSAAVGEDSGVYYLEASNSLGKDQSRRIVVDVTPSLNAALELEGEPSIQSSPKESDDSYSIYQTEETWDGEDALEIYAKYRRSSLMIPSSASDRTLKFRWKVSEEMGGSFEILVRSDSSSSYYVTLNGLGTWQEETLFLPANHSMDFRLNPWDGYAKAWLDAFEEVKEPFVIRGTSFTFPQTNQPVQLDADVHAVEATYQWFKDGSPLPGETSLRMNIASYSPANNGSYHLVAKNAFGEVSTPPVELEPNASNGIVQIPSDISFSGNPRVTIEDAGNDEYPAKVRIEVGDSQVEQPERSWAFSFPVNGPATFKMDSRFGSSNVYLELDESKKWIPSARNTAALFIPQGPHILKISVDPSSFLNWGEIYSMSLSNAPLAQIELNYEPHLGQQYTPLASYTGAEPLTLAWFKNGEQISRQTNLQSGEAFPYDRSSTPSDQGDYYYELTDVHGNTARSDVVTYSLLNYIPEVLDAKGSQISLSDSLHDQLHYDFETKAEGSSSLLLSGPFSEINGYGLRLLELTAYGTFKIRSLGFPESSVISYGQDGEMYSIPANAEWTEITVGNNIHGISLALPESTAESKIWIDDYKPIARAYFSEHPLNTETFIGAKVELKARAFESGNPYVNLRWYKDGLEIPGNGGYPITIDPVTYEDLGEYIVKATSKNGDVIVSNPATLSLISGDFAKAIGFPGARITTQGHAPWEIDYDNSIDGPSSIVSGDLLPGERSTITIEFDGPASWGVYAYRVSEPGITDTQDLDRWLYRRVKYNPSSSVRKMELKVDEYTPTEGLISQKLRLDRMSLTRLSPLQYSQWIADMTPPNLSPFDESLTDKSADLDGDGVSNWLEFVIGGDPLTPDIVPNWTFVDFSTPDAETVVRFQAVRTGDYSITYEASSDFLNWTRVYPQVETQNIDTHYDQKTAKLKIDSTITYPYFLRWNIHQLSQDDQGIFINSSQ